MASYNKWKERHKVLSNVDFLSLVNPGSSTYGLFRVCRIKNLNIFIATDGACFKQDGCKALNLISFEEFLEYLNPEERIPFMYHLDLFVG